MERDSISNCEIEKPTWNIPQPGDSPSDQLDLQRSNKKLSWSNGGIGGPAGAGPSPLVVNGKVLVIYLFFNIIQ